VIQTRLISDYSFSQRNHPEDGPHEWPKHAGKHNTLKVHHKVHLLVFNTFDDL